MSSDTAAKPAGVPEPADSTPTVISKAIPQAGSTPASFHEPLRGKRLAHFELLEAAGVGGMAAVIKARDLQLERIVALKILPPDMAKDPDNIERFHQEARAAARLDHENIARAFYCGEDQALHFIAFEYVEGENLRTILDRRGALPVREAVHYMLQVATGLAHAASRGVVHRDIKPSNIIITPTGRAKLVDMGLARSLEQPFDKGLTHSGITLGTFDYISPEQAEEPRNADVRSDIYSLGCTFYHVLTGQPPVPEGTAAKKLKHHQAVPPIDPRQLNPAIPDEVTAILARMMAKDPKDRYQRAEQLVQQLILVAQHLGATAAIPEGPLYVDAAFPTPPRSRPVFMAVVAAVALVVLVLLIGQLSHSGSPPDEEFHLTGPVQNAGPEPSVGEARSSAVSVDAGRGSPVVPAARHLVYNEKTATAAAVAAKLNEAKPQDDCTVILPNDLDLSDPGADARPLLTFAGRRLVLEARDPSHPVTIHLSDGGLSADKKSWIALLEACNCSEVILKGIRFVVETDAPQCPFACLLLRNCGDCRLQQCEFVQIQSGAPAITGQRSAAIVVEGNKEPKLNLQTCCFLAAQGCQSAAMWENATLVDLDQCPVDAVLARCPCRITALDCAFGPHNALFHADSNLGRNFEIECTDCSAMLSTDSSAFLLESSTNAVLTLKRSLFTRTGSGDNPEGTLVRQNGDPGKVQIRNSDGNVSYFVKFWDGGEENAAGEQALKDAFVASGGSPWRQESSFKSLPHTKLRDLFAMRGQLVPGRTVGAMRLPGFAPFEVETPVETSQTLIVDPGMNQSGGGKYKSLQTAIREARRGDQIVIRHNGVFKEKSIDVDRADLDTLEIRPDDGYRPVLMLQDDDPERTDLFRVLKGKVQFKQIEFVLQPQVAEDSRSQTVFAIYPGAQVNCDGCVFTLDRSLRNASLAVARVGTLEQDSAVRTDLAHLSLDKCFVRADGDLVKLRGDRSCNLELALSNSLLALGESLLSVDGVTADGVANSSLHLDMRQVTTYVQGSLVRMQATEKVVRTTIPLRGDQISNCLFVSLGAPILELVRVEPLPMTDGTGSGKLFTWKSERNGYASFTRMLDEKMLADIMPSNLEIDSWKQSYEPPDSKFSMMKPTVPEPPVSQFRPGDLKRSDTWKDFGASPESLPSPRWNGKTAVP